MIKDLFSHKIHSSKPEWSEKLIELACIFEEFDTQLYDRKAIEKRLQNISPRATFVARDPSKFRDEISAYPAYLGLYRLEIVNDKWHFFLCETAKRYLTIEEPNVGAFMLLQLSLFQYPNGMGVAYYSNSNKYRVQANTRDRTLGIIEKGIHISPLRLICKGLEADADLKQISIFEARINAKELFTLANQSVINSKILPILSDVKSILTKSRNALVFPPKSFENRSHILNHTDFIKSNRGFMSIRQPINEFDRKDLKRKFKILCNLDVRFKGFDKATTEEELGKVISKGSWSHYFDSITTFSSEVIEILANDTISSISESDILNDIDFPKPKIDTPLTYPLKKRGIRISPSSNTSKEIQFADPEVTKIKRQKSNLSHKIILQQLDEYLRGIGAEPYENEHIDLFAKIPRDGKFLFEVKSVLGNNLLSQTRKGISQLYEYRFRYKSKIGYDDITLCLVYPNEPSSIKWLQEYLCADRKVAVIWFSDDGELKYSNFCENQVAPLLLR